MKIHEYIKTYITNKTEFSRKIGISTTHLYDLINGIKRPSVPLAERIEKVTDGIVTKEESLFNGPSAKFKIRSQAKECINKLFGKARDKSIYSKQ